jgi:hypothetical protein
MTSRTGKQFAEYAKSLLGKPYMYGNNGWIITDALIDAKIKQYPYQYRDLQSDIRKYGMTKVQYLRTKNGERGYDCSSIADLFTGHDKSADGWLAAAVVSGSIESLPDLAGVTVHFPGHMGVYMGDKTVVEARGTFYGVVRTNLKDRPWKFWAKLPGIDYSGGDGDMLKQGDRGDLVKVWQQLLMAGGYKMIDSKGVEHFDDGSFGGATESATREFQTASDIVSSGQVDFITIMSMAKRLLQSYKNEREISADAMTKLQLISNVING